MLLELGVRAHPYFGDLILSLHKGFAAITGASGAGKSRFLEILSLIFGQKTIAVEEDMRIHACLHCTPPMAEYLSAKGLPVDDVVIVERLVGANKRSRFWINRSPVLAKDIQDFADEFVLFCAQHQLFTLRDPLFALNLIDDSAHLTEAQTIKTLYTEIKNLNVEKEALLKGQNESAIELLRYQVEEFNQVAIGPEEALSLLNEFKQLSKFSDHKEAYTHAQASLQDIILPELSQTLHRLNMNAELCALGKEAQILLEEMLHGVQHHCDANLDEERYKFVENRLNTFYALARKHRVNIEQLYELHTSLQQKLTFIEGGLSSVELLDKQLIEKQKEAQKLASELSAKRKIQATLLAKQISKNFIQLGLLGQSLVFDFSPKELGEKGIDAVSLCILQNGQTRPLHKGTSGGEQSRILLSIYEVLSNTHAKIIIFDEIDAGLSGALTTSVGMMLKSLSTTHHVLTITHHAQVAALADHQLLVEKTKNKATVKNLEGKERIEALAALISDGQNQETATAHAKALLAKALET